MYVDDVIAQRTTRPAITHKETAETHWVNQTEPQKMSRVVRGQQVYMPVWTWASRLCPLACRERNWVPTLLISLPLRNMCSR